MWKHLAENAATTFETQPRVRFNLSTHPINMFHHSVLADKQWQEKLQVASQSQSFVDSTMLRLNET